MTSEYLLLKFFHILIAILALGTSAGLGVALELYGSHPTHGPFLLRRHHADRRVLRAARRRADACHGRVDGERGWLLTRKPIQEAMAFAGVGIADLVNSQRFFVVQICLLEA